MSNTAVGKSTGSDAASTVQSVDRAIVILEILARSGEVGVTELARELGVHKSTAFRLVAALERRDLVEQNAGRGKYRLGTGILRLAGATTSRLDLVQESRTVTRALAQHTGETVNLAVLSDGAALYMDQIAGSSALQPHNWVGQRIPLHATSNGKVLLSALDRSEVARQVPALRAYTANTITTLEGSDARARGGSPAGFRDRHRRAGDRSDRGCGPGPQHPWRGDGVAEHLRPDVPARRAARAADDRCGRGGGPGGVASAGVAGMSGGRAGRIVGANRHEIETCRVLTNCAPAHHDAVALTDARCVMAT